MNSLAAALATHTRFEILSNINHWHSFIQRCVFHVVWCSQPFATGSGNTQYFKALLCGVVEVLGAGCTRLYFMYVYTYICV